MEYRILPHGGEKISAIGLGSGSLTGTKEEIVSLLNLTIDNGINYFDLAPSEQAPFFAYADAFSGRREQIITQMHFGAVYANGTYGWTRDLTKIKEQFQWTLGLLKTDYTDMGFIHCVDDEDDLDAVMQNGLWDYMKGLKQAGIIRHLGFSSHNPAIARRILETGLVDLFMFSINPAYDCQKGIYGVGETAERTALYQDCADMGVGISVMKPFGGGRLLDASLSPFQHALTKNQCLQYALARPGVLTVLPGVRNKKDLLDALTYFQAENGDDFLPDGFDTQGLDGTCVYCNHCQPCPAGLNVGLINKYYDLAVAGDILAAGHYQKLNLHAGDCIRCGHCEARCPFHVKQEERMQEIARYFKQ
ncbi:aldo/keto reductase [Anaerolentibacter hominis]|uniref:aldo/keto reductase n=1 Tax=Anaerolentibacter hominis TaxID=3079009 RepID=UPI0031B84DFC